MVLGGITSYSKQAVHHYPRVSSAASLHCAHTFLLLFRSHFFTTYLLLLVVPRVSRINTAEVSGVLYPAHSVCHWTGVISGMSQMVVVSTNFLSGPHGTGSVVVLGLFPSELWPQAWAWVVLSWTLSCPQAPHPNKYITQTMLVESFLSSETSQARASSFAPLSTFLSSRIP